MNVSGFVRIVRVAAALVVLLGLSALALPTLVPFEVAKSHFDSMAVDGSVEILTPEYYRVVRARLTTLSVFLMTLGAIGVFFREPVGRYVERLARSFSANVRTLVLDARSVRHHGAHFIALCGLILIALLVRLYFIDQPMRPDETFTFLRHVPLPPYLIVSDYDPALPNNHVLHTLLVKLSCACFGDAPWAIRLPVLVAGVLLVPVTYGVGYMLYGKSCGLLGAGLTGSSSVLVEYSTNARGYGLVTLAFMLGLMLAIYLKSRTNWVAWVLLVAVSALGFYAMPLMLYPFGIVVTWLFLTASMKETLREKLFLGRRTLLCGAVVVVATTVLYTPILVALADRGYPRPAGVFTAASRQRWDLLATTWEQWNRSVPAALMYALLAGLLVATVFHRRMSDYVSLLVAALLWCVPVILVHGVVPEPRQWQFLLPVHAILSAAGLAYLYERSVVVRKRSELFAVLVLALSAALGSNLMRTRSPTIDRTPVAYVEELCEYLDSRFLPGQKVVALSPSASPMAYYFYRLGIDPDRLVTRQTRNPFADSTEASSIYVVVYTDAPHKSFPGESFESIDYCVGLSKFWDVSSATLVREYDSARLYELQRASQ